MISTIDHDEPRTRDAVVKHRRVGAGLWPRRTLKAAPLIVAGADLTRLTEWVEEGQRRAERIL